ncbi:MAG: hypothetical protein M1824_005550 [Vezdaea acicularis]|nr:MAG: hypothetical protein M1824_005550 [Vezdaea acicularis]
MRHRLAAFPDRRDAILNYQTWIPDSIQDPYPPRVWTPVSINYKRKDLLIDCGSYDVPPQRVFPQGRSRNDYTDLFNLCSFTGRFASSNGRLSTFARRGLSQNVGCACTHPGETEDVTCHPPPAMDEAFALHHPIIVVCETLCKCRKPVKPPEQVHKPARRVDIRTQGVTAWEQGGKVTAIFGPPLYETAYTRTYDSSAFWGYLGEKEEGCVAGANGKYEECLWHDAFQTLDPKPRARPDPVRGGRAQLPKETGIETRRCSGGDCLSNMECSFFNGCVCSAIRSATLGLAAYASHGACKSNLIGKRDLAVGSMECRCNGTFVSERCCEVVDGLVWDTPNLFRG